jgi:hypothetical protein
MSATPDALDKLFRFVPRPSGDGPQGKSLSEKGDRHLADSEPVPFF